MNKFKLTTIGTIALLTFGYQSTNPNSACSNKHDEIGCRVATGVLSGIAFPLYWTYHAFEFRLKNSDALQTE